MVFDRILLDGTVYKRVTLIECVQGILDTTNQLGWTIEIDDRLPNFRMAAFTPRLMSAHQAFQNLAEAYMAEVTIREAQKVIRFSLKSESDRSGWMVT